jgi:uncharacterized cupin superfamily protein
VTAAAGGVVHWDDVPGGEGSSAGRVPGLDASWQDLGTAAGSREVGLARIRVEPGEQATPPHRHAAEEEIFWVLGGSGLAWHDGATCEIRPGDCLVYLAGGPLHTVRAGREGLDVLAFGERRPAELCLLPRAGSGFLGNRWVPTADEHPWWAEHRAGPLPFPPPGPRPDSVVQLEDAPAERRAGRTIARVRADLGLAAGSRRTGLKHVRVEPGMLGAPPHCHSAEEELFVVLEGDGTLLLGDEEVRVRAGHVVSRPAGTGVAHAFRAGSSGLVHLAYGQRVPDDACFYPRSGKVSFRGLGVIGRLEQLDYWDGED